MRREYTSAEYRQIVASRIHEKEWMQQVIDLARMLGYLVYHTHNSIRSEKGYPDLMCIRPPRLIVVEVKTLKGRLTPEQKKWLEWFKACGVETYVWRPNQLEEIIEILQRTA